MPLEPVTLLEKKRILLGVTGSIAAYKAIDLASKLTQLGARVDVIMTEAAQRFVTPLTFGAVTGRPVYTDLWNSAAGSDLPTHIAHVGLGEGADLLVIAPATADTIARLASGFANDLLAITALAARCPVLVAPAMDGGMYAHPATQANLATLSGRGVVVLPPDEGRFASGLTGRGRLPDTSALLGAIRTLLGRDGLLKERRVVVTAGGTREALDPVRYITNRSSGKQGYALAQAALDAGAQVTLISAARALVTPYGATLIPVESARAMQEAVLDATAEADALIMAAAVADFRPRTTSDQKIKKSDELTLLLDKNPDILLSVYERRKSTQMPRVVVGFAAESQNLAAYARDKLERKGLDLLVANDISASDAGFDVDSNRVLIFDAGSIEPQELSASKALVSEAIIVRVARLARRKGSLMITLVPMTEDDFQPYIDWLTAAFAKDQIAAGNWDESDAVERSAASIRHSLPDGLATPGHFLYFVRDEAVPETVGQTWLMVNRDAEPAAFIMDIEIYAAYQRRGYAQATLQALEEQARALGIHKIGLNVHAWNRGAQALYEKQGYAVTEHTMLKRLDT